MFLLQTQALNANDIMFRVTDVVFIVSGVITLLTAWFAFKSAQSKTEDRITLEVARGDEKRAAIKVQFDILKDELKRFEDRVRSIENSLDTIEVDLGKRIDSVDRNVQSVNLSIEKMKSEILERLLDKK